MEGKADVAHQMDYINPVTSGACSTSSTCKPVSDPISGFQWAHIGLLDTAASDGIKLKDRSHPVIVQFHGHKECSDDGQPDTQPNCTSGSSGEPNGIWGTKFPSSYANHDAILGYGGKKTVSGDVVSYSKLSVPGDPAKLSYNSLIKSVRDVISDISDKNMRYADGSLVRVGSTPRQLAATYALYGSSEAGTKDGLSGTKNAQGTYANSIGLKFLHIELDGFARQVYYEPTSSTWQPGFAQDQIEPPPGSGLTAVDPNLLTLLARKVIWTVDDWTVSNISYPLSKALTAALASLETPWDCPATPVFGLDNDEYLDKENPLDPAPGGVSEYQRNPLAYPNDSTLYAQARHTNLKFVFSHLDSPNYLRPLDSSGVPVSQENCSAAASGGDSWFQWRKDGSEATATCKNLYGKNLDPSTFPRWTTHREQLQRAGLMVFPVYFAPIACPPWRPATECGTYGGNSDMPARVKDSPTRILGDGIFDAKNAYDQAEKQGFQDGTTIYLDLEDPNYASDSDGSVIHTNTQAYVRSWVYWFTQRQAAERSGPQYKVGIYCDSANCAWLQQSLIHMAGTEPAWFGTDYGTPLGYPAWQDVNYGIINWWVHDWSCGSAHNVDQCTNPTCSGTASPANVVPPVYSGPGSAQYAGCSIPQVADFPLVGSMPDWSSFTTAASKYVPSNSSFADAFMWQYAATPPDLDSACTTNSSVATANHYVLADLKLTTPGYQCRLPQVGDFYQYTQDVDLVSMDTSCIRNVAKIPKPPAIPRYPHGTASFTSYAQAISSFLTSPNGDPVVTASDLGETTEFILHVQSVYTAGGSQLVDGTLVEDADYVQAPTEGNPIQNSDFETADTSGWTTVGKAEAVAVQPAWGGVYVAQVGSESATTDDSGLMQTFTVPAAGYRSLSFYYRITCPDTVYYDQFWVTLYDNTTKTNYVLVPETCTNTGLWTRFEYPLAGFEGHSLSIGFWVHDDGAAGDPTYALVDEVKLSTIGNGNFESGSLGQWSSTGSTSVYQQSSGSSAAYGAYAAMVGSTAPTIDNTLSQSFQIPSSGVSTLAFDTNIVCPDTLTYDWASVTLVDNTSGQTYTLMPDTCTNTGGWSTTTFSVDALAGHNVTLTFSLHDDDNSYDPSYMLVDFVRLQ